MAAFIGLVVVANYISIGFIIFMDIPCAIHMGIPWWHVARGFLFGPLFHTIHSLIRFSINPSKEIKRYVALFKAIGRTINSMKKTQ